MSLRETAMEWKRQWIEEGRRQGYEEGHRRGAARLLSYLLQLKFGVLPPEVWEGIQEADEEFLLIHWSNRLLEAQSREEIFGMFPSPEEGEVYEDEVEDEEGEVEEEDWED